MGVTPFACKTKYTFMPELKANKVIYLVVYKSGIKSIFCFAYMVCHPSILPDPIPPEEVRRVIKNSREGAGGPDAIRYGHLKELSEDEVVELTEEMNESIQTGVIPEDWLHSFLAPIPKPGKDHSVLKGYRVITMQNVCGKILEKIVARRLSRELEDKKLLPNGLGSYRPGRDTTINAAVVAYDVYEGFQNKKETVIAAIDLEDAYNRVDYMQLVQKMMQLDLDPFLVRWVAGAMLTRKVAMKCGTWASDPKEIAPGLPQGSPLSPVLFNIYTAELSRHSEAQSGRTLTFADDVNAYEQGNDRIHMAKELQNRLHKIEEWCEENNAITNPEKAQVLWCSLDNRIVNDPTPPITMDHEIIERETELKYLGITFDRSLSFGKHVENTVCRARKGIGALKVMANAMMPQKFLFIMMRLVVLSVMDYGLGLLTLSKTQIEKLERVQNEAMRTVLGCTRDTPIACLRHILGLPSIATRHKVAQAKMYLRVMEMDGHPLHPALKEERGTRIKRGKSWMAQAEESIRTVCDLDDITEGREWLDIALEVRQDLTKVIIDVKKSDMTEVAGRAETEVRQIIDQNSKPSDPIIYTDGSVTRGMKSGWGFLIQTNGHIMHKASGACNKTTSSTRMEVEAVTKSLEWMRQHMPSTKYAVVVTDSQNILKRVDCGKLRKEWIGSIEGSRLRKITWIYAPSHTGVVGNELADKLASGAVINSTIKMDKQDIIKALTDALVEKEIEATQSAVARIEEIGIKRGSGRTSMLTGIVRRTTNQRNTGTISRKTLEWMLHQGTEHLWQCPECKDVVPDNK